MDVFLIVAAEAWRVGRPKLERPTRPAPEPSSEWVDPDEAGPLLLATPPGQLAQKFGVRFGHDLVDIAGFDGGLAALGFHQFVANIKQDGGTTLFRRAGEPSAALI